MKLARDNIIRIQRGVRLRQVPYAEVTLLYANDYWDGPISGMCRWRGEEYYYWSDRADAEDNTRTFLLIRLTPAQRAEEKRLHELFVEKVSDNHVYVTNEVKHGVRDKSVWPEFYDIYDKTVATELVPEQLVGYFLEVTVQ